MTFLDKFQPQGLNLQFPLIFKGLNIKADNQRTPELNKLVFKYFKLTLYLLWINDRVNAFLADSPDSQQD